MGTKSVFAKIPKLNFTNADIDANHPGPGLNDKLKSALRYLPALGIKGILQGDLLFTKGDIKSDTIESVNYITFQPNTIVYAVPADSPLAKTIRAAELGIVFHTSYHGASIQDMKASYNVDLSSLTNTKMVWFRDASFVDNTGSATFTKEETGELTQVLGDAGRLLRQLPSRIVKDILVQTSIVAALKKFENSQIREGRSINKPAQFVAKFIQTYEAELNKAILDAKRPDTKMNRTKEKTITINFLRRNQGTLVTMIELMNKLVAAKMLVLRKIQQIKGLGTFLRTDTGFKATSPEGFVAVSLAGGNAVKLVDRLEFSQANFTAAKQWEK